MTMRDSDLARPGFKTTAPYTGHHKNPASDKVHPADKAVEILNISENPS